MKSGNDETFVERYERLLSDLELLAEYVGDDASGERVTQAIAYLQNTAIPLYERLENAEAFMRDTMTRVRNREKYIERPVSATEFITSPDYMAAGDVLWPAVLEEVEEICSGRWIEAVLTGGIGAAKTTIALYGLAYELYKLLLLRDPHEEWGLDSASEIVIIMQSLTSSTAKTVDYQRFRRMMMRSPWFRKNGGLDVRLESAIHLRNNILVQPLSSKETAAIGENVIGGIIDEVNFMEVVANSARTSDGGLFDQAQKNYEAIARRRESRFMRVGTLPGMLFLVSSANYPGQFTDRKKDEAVMPGARVYVYDKRIWEVAPEGRFSPERFTVFPGDAARVPFIVTPQSRGKLRAEDDALLIDVPEDYRHRFEANIYGAIRDICGVATTVMRPYFWDQSAVIDAFDHGYSVFSRQTIDLSTEQYRVVLDDVEDPKIKRWVHIDLALTHDAVGLAVAHIREFRDVSRVASGLEGSETFVERLPVFVFDGLLQIRPPSGGGEIDLAQVRAIVYALKEAGLNVTWVSFDQYQSAGTRQELHKGGFLTGQISVDRDTRGYDILREAINDGRVEAPPNDIARQEIARLTYDSVKRKVDHPPNGSKDVADAMAGAVKGLFARAEIWMAHGVFPGSIEGRYMPAKDDDVDAA